jgi:hypothetical protein
MDTQGVGNPREISERRIAKTLLHAPHVRAMQSGLVCQTLLRPTFFLSEFANPFADGLRNDLRALRHASSSCECFQRVDFVWVGYLLVAYWPVPCVREGVPLRDRVRCPLCARATSRRILRTRNRASSDVCLLCRGTRHISSTEYTWFVSLRRQMQRVADAMQREDPDRAYREARTAGGIARALLES